MVSSRPFTYNTGSVVPGTEQFCDIALGSASLDYSSQPGGLIWWMGPDEDNRYIIAKDVPTKNWPTPVGDSGSMRFWASKLQTEASFIDVSERVTKQNFTTGNGAKSYLNTNGYWTNYEYTIEELTGSLATSKIYQGGLYSSYDDKIYYQSASSTPNTWYIMGLDSNLTESLVSTGLNMSNDSITDINGQNIYFQSDFSGSTPTNPPTQTWMSKLNVVGGAVTHIYKYDIDPITFHPLVRTFTLDTTRNKTVATAMITTEYPTVSSRVRGLNFIYNDASDLSFSTERSASFGTTYSASTSDYPVIFFNSNDGMLYYGVDNLDPSVNVKYGWQLRKYDYDTDTDSVVNENLEGYYPSFYAFVSSSNTLYYNQYSGSYPNSDMRYFNSYNITTNTTTTIISSSDTDSKYISICVYDKTNDVVWGSIADKIVGVDPSTNIIFYEITGSNLPAGITQIGVPGIKEDLSELWLNTSAGITRYPY